MRDFSSFSLTCTLALAGGVAIAGHALAQQRQPHVGYLYPAGAQQGLVVQVVAGGQFLNNPTNVYVSGEGVRASVVKSAKGRINLNKEQQWLLLNGLLEVWEKRLREAGLDDAEVEKMREKTISRWPWSMLKRKDVDVEGETLPDHPLLTNLSEKSVRELLHVKEYYFFPRRRLQLNRQLDELVVLEVAVDPGASPGGRELRLGTRGGLTNPMLFQVGQLPEVSELEPNDIEALPVPGNLKSVDAFANPECLELPVLLNGQIMPGDADRFRFRAGKGRLVIEANARRLIPYLADAVPGWFQATLTLYDADGRELAFADDYLFNPDPVLTYDVPRSGEYEIEIRDAIYRGREDFVYRVSVSDRTYFHEAFPAENVPSDLFPVGAEAIPACDETECNDDAKRAQPIALPRIISGRIDKAGDVDVFRIRGNAGNRIVAEVYARRLGSPLDSLVRLIDASGKVIAWNDDHVLKEEHLHVDRLGLITHHADSYLAAELPMNGTCTIQLSDAQGHGGEEYGYRLRIGGPYPDFALRVTPSSLCARPGETMPVHVYALRRDGFAGPIDIGVDEGTGFGITGGRRIAAGCNSLRVTVTAPPDAPDAPVDLKLNGTATIAGETVSRTAVPAEDVMQAFLYRHLVPSKQLLCLVRQQRWRMPPMDYAGTGPVRLEAGGIAQVRIKVAKRRDLARMRLALSDPPEGVSVDETVTEVEEGITFRLKASESVKPADFKGNLIVQVFKEDTTPAGDGKPARRNRWPFTHLPAIPIEIVSPSS